MRDAKPTLILRRNYQPPAFLIDHVALDFALDEKNTRVRSRLSVRRNPAVPRADDLVLDGEALVLRRVVVNGEERALDTLAVDEASLRVPGVPDVFTLEIETECDPAGNTVLEGLYLSGGNFCTQCEAEGFRRITYYLDRPDVMATFRVRMEADQARYPSLLSNGNLIEEGSLDGGRHFAVWEDPFKKPAYLFALVAGGLVRREDTFTTMSGRQVRLHVYVREEDLDRTAHCMESLKQAMTWDEQVYGREYDLDLYQIVAVSDFNMGAMENKGLNVFNTKYVLASPESATDTDFLGVQGVVAHEYFHNWSGNRVTCRDWFQLSLKEGFTVFRDQEFSADHGSRAVKRIEDVQKLRANQLPEDAGPTAHPVRPDAYVEINNFYTVTVYEKGAEVVRMLHTLLGAEAFRRGTDLYFSRHDGQAVTCDDFVKALEDASGKSLEQFRLWYEQAGTPKVRASYVFDKEKGTLTVTLAQSIPDTPGQTNKAPMHIPVSFGLLGEDGSDLPLRVEGEAVSSTSTPGTTRVLELCASEQSWTFTGLSKRPVPSPLRGFSAPVRLEESVPEEDLLFRMAHDGDAFARWDAAQAVALRLLLEAVPHMSEGRPLAAPEPFLAAFARALDDREADPALLALALDLPREAVIAEELSEVDPGAIHNARDQLRALAARACRDTLQARYQELAISGPYTLDSDAIGRRMLRNLCLGYLVSERTNAGDVAGAARLAADQLSSATNMTDRIAALAQLTHLDHPSRDEALQAYYERFRDDALALDKWFAVQAMSRRSDVLDQLEALLKHPSFERNNPNKVRALLGTFAAVNPSRFHATDGRGYRFLADRILEIDAYNPRLAARLVPPLARFHRLEPVRRGLAEAQVQRILGHEGVSKDVYEIASKALASS